MRKEVLWMLGVLLGSCWAQAQQPQVPYQGPVPVPGAGSAVTSPAVAGGPGVASPVAGPYTSVPGPYGTPLGYGGAPAGYGYGMMTPYGGGMMPPAGYGVVAGPPSMVGPPPGALDDHGVIDGAVVPSGMGCMPRCWFDVSYLVAWLQRGPLNGPLVTLGSPTDAHPGALGQPGTVAVFGANNFNTDATSGILVDTGGYLDCENHLGGELRGFYISPQRTNAVFASGPTGIPLITRPVFNTLFRQERSFITSSPGTVAGLTDVTSRSEMWGFETNALVNIGAAPSLSADLLGGFRLVQLDERLDIQDRLNPLVVNRLSPPVTFLGAAVNPPSFVTDHDKFQTWNTFYGLNLGGRLRWQYNWLSLLVYSKVALGVTDERIRIDGTTTLVTPTTTRTVPGGILALPSNIVSHTHEVFSVVPETGLTLGIDPIPHVRLLVGYNFLWWSNVARPGAQIDRSINPLQVPTDINFRAGNVTPPPVFVPRDSSFWLQTVNFGVELYY
jgi:hypothetical protein